MVRMHSSLRAKVERIKNAPVRFSKRAECFVVEKKRKHGLTKLLSRLVPVPTGKKTESAVLISATPPEFVVPDTVAHFAGSVMKRCGTCVSALECQRAKQDTIGQMLRDEKSKDKAHGIVVDHQLKLYAKHGRDGLFRQNLIIDPCVGTLLEQFDANGWSIVGAQLPIFDSTSDVATAIDLLATDRRTGKEMILVEIKASLPRRSDDTNYALIRGVLKNTDLHDLPQSYHSRHQVQLLFMQQTLERELQVAADKSVVMRVSPGTVRTYKLQPVFAARSADVMKAIAACLRRKKQPKRKRRASTKNPK